MENQRTLKSRVSFRGVGLHMGEEVALVLEPAPPDAGVVFVREDLPGSPSLKAKARKVVSNERGTTIGKGEVRVSTVEHILAALAGLKIDNVIIRMDGEEVPAADGSALPFVNLIQKAGVVEQPKPRQVFKIKEPIWIQEGERSLTVLPYPGLKIAYTVDFSHSWLKSQFAEFVIAEDTFIKEIAPSRTFGFMDEVEELKKRGLIKGGSLENAVLIDEEGVVNKEGLRFPNEPVRHKILDLIGDLYLLEKPIEGHIIAVKSGHFFNIKLIQRLREMEENLGRPFLDIREIEKILPHRFPFLLVDRIEYIEEDKIVGVKNVTINEPFFSGHFPGHPVMPAALILEAMAQVAGVFLLSKSENQGKLAYFGGIDKARFRRPVVPGDQLRTEVKILNIRRAAGKVKAICKVEEEVVAEAEFLFTLVER